MRAIRYMLLASGVLAAFALSAVLLIREFSPEAPRIQSQAVAPPAENAEREIAAPAKDQVPDELPEPATEARQPPAEVSEPPAESRQTSDAPGRPEIEANTSTEMRDRAAGAQPAATAPAATDITIGAAFDGLGRPVAGAPAQTPTRNGKVGSVFDPLFLPPAGMIGAEARPPQTSRPHLQQSAVRPGPLSLSAEQQQKIRDLLLTHNIMQSPASEFPLQLGAIVPVEVVLMPMPHEVAEAIPDYRSYSYVIAHDRIVIVATETRAIRFLIAM